MYVKLIRILLVAGVVALTPAPVDAQHDPSPHRELLVTTAPGVRIHLLDWGGSGPSVLMLPGYGFSAHIYDDFAPRLTGFRVVAMTVRGWHPSDAPASGYTYDAIADDIRAVIDSMHLGPTALVGHSFGGSLITRAAARHPDRIRAVLYLDGAIQNAPRDSVFRENPIRRPPQPESSDTTLRGQIGAWRAYAERNFYGTWTPALEADLWARGSGVSDAEFARRDSLIRRFGVEDPRDKMQVDFASFAQPALAICAITSRRYQYPWLTPDSPEWVRAEEFTRGTLIPFQRRECRMFRSLALAGDAMEIESGHYLFLNRPKETAAAVLRFLRRH